MSFRLATIFYLFAVLAASLATFGAVGGSCAAAMLLAFWGGVIYARWPPVGRFGAVIVIRVVMALVALLLPAVQTARGAAQRSQCANNIKQIALALLNYHDTRRTYPPAYILNAAGKPMHSWRVMILPFLEETVLYQNYNMNEPWDGPNNSKLAVQIPNAYRCPTQKDDPNSNPLETNYFVVVGPGTVFPGRHPGRNPGTISDGTAHTIAVIEASGLGIN